MNLFADIYSKRVRAMVKMVNNAIRVDIQRMKRGVYVESGLLFKRIQLIVIIVSILYNLFIL